MPVKAFAEEWPITEFSLGYSMDSVPGAFDDLIYATRRAYVPKLYLELWKSNLLLAKVKEQTGWARRTVVRTER
jgi:hypothetical protein